MNNGNTGFWPDSEITMQNGREAIAKQFEDMKEAFFAGVTVNELVLNRSMFIDELMLRLYRQFNFNE
jgi:[protein-PII] uridylyltransferase